MGDKQKGSIPSKLSTSVSKIQNHKQLSSSKIVYSPWPADCLASSEVWCRLRQETNHGFLTAIYLNIISVSCFSKSAFRGQKFTTSTSSVVLELFPK